MSWPINPSYAFYDQTDRHCNSCVIAHCFICVRAKAIQPHEIGAVADADTDSDGDARAGAKSCAGIHTYSARAIANAVAANRATDISAASNAGARAKPAVNSIEKIRGRATANDNVPTHRADANAGEIDFVPATNADANADEINLVPTHHADADSNSSKIDVVSATNADPNSG